ncbi:hypothetical protein BJY59DRAFT_722121 [Rhodotorula toruloides]
MRQSAGILACVWSYAALARCCHEEEDGVGSPSASLAPSATFRRNLSASRTHRFVDRTDSTLRSVRRLATEASIARSPRSDASLVCCGAISRTTSAYEHRCCLLPTATHLKMTLARREYTHDAPPGTDFLDADGKAHSVHYPMPSDSIHDPLVWKPAYKAATYWLGAWWVFWACLPVGALSFIYPALIRDYNMTPVDISRVMGWNGLVLALVGFILLPYASAYGRRPMILLSNLVSNGIGLERQWHWSAILIPGIGLQYALEIGFITTLFKNSWVFGLGYFMNDLYVRVGPLKMTVLISIPLYAAIVLTVLFLWIGKATRRFSAKFAIMQRD